jgi:adenylosuccinate lyase
MFDPAAVDNPLVTRYASREMAEIWSPARRYSTWRRLWLALAETQVELGLTDETGQPRIRIEQIEAMRRHLDDIDFARVGEYEQRFRHDVMAHIHAFADVCPEARDIIHLGATSCFVTDNADLILMRDALDLLLRRLATVIRRLAQFARQWKDEATLGFTHFQPAQLTTIGKRACLWIHDLVLDWHELQHRRSNLRFRGAKGTTGTQASFLTLFRGDHAKVRELDRRVARKMGFDDVFPVTGQTYSRKVDAQILSALGGIGQTVQKWGADLRLLAHRQEIDEPFEEEQVGSSAMAYKRNPMRAERMCSLGRFLDGLAPLAGQTAAAQWLERTLDDSAIRRLIIPQAFLAADAVLRLAANLAGGLIVNVGVVRRAVSDYLPYLATEPILMAGVQKGGDRQLLHEIIRRHSHDVTTQIKQGGPNDLISRLQKEPALATIDWTQILDPRSFVGRAPEQVEEFLSQDVEPIVQLATATEATDDSLRV